MIINFLRKKEAKVILSENDPRYDHSQKLSSKKYIRPLITLLKDANSDIRQKAAWLLGSISDIQAVDPLIHLLINDKEDIVKNNAAEALRR